MAQESCGDLTKHETDVLLGLYSGCECLWNTKNPDYKDKKIRVGAIRTIINGMRLETGKDFTTSQMQAALDTISKKYWQELQQALEAENSSGNGFKSQWRWFNFLDSFLRENMLHAQTLGLDVVDVDKAEVKAQKQEEDGNDTDDYFCATVDSGGEEEEEDSSQLAGVSKRRGQMQVLPSQSRTPPSSSARPSRSRASSRRQEVSVLINGSGYGAQSSSPTTPHTPTPTSRKRRREAAVAPATRSSLASAAGASGNSAPHSRHSGGAGSSAPPHTRSAKTAAAAAAAATGRLALTDACQSDSVKISAQMADTLKAMQILLATSLTDQDQPAMVFARHIANELQQITDYAQRKQCMLDLQQVILRYQTKQQQQPQQSATAARVKFEGRGEGSEEEEVVVGSGDRGTGNRASATTTSQQQSSEEPLLLYFDTP